MTDKPKRRWFQYSLRSMFVLTTLVAVACSWYATEMQKAAKREAFIVEILELGGVAYYDSGNYGSLRERPRWISWLRKLDPDEHPGNTVTGISSRQITDAGLLQLEGLPNLKYVIWYAKTLHSVTL